MLEFDAIDNIKERDIIATECYEVSSVKHCYEGQSVKMTQIFDNIKDVIRFIQKYSHGKINVNELNGKFNFITLEFKYNRFAEDSYVFIVRKICNDCTEIKN